MPILLLLGLGAVVVLAARSSKARTTTAGPPIIDPTKSDPILAEPITVQKGGAMYLNPGWAELAFYRLLRYKLGEQTDLPGDGARREANLFYKDDIDKISASLYETALGWIKQQNKAGRAILVSSNLAFAPVTEGGANVRKFNPHLPPTIQIIAVYPAQIPTYAAPGRGIAVFIEKPNQLDTLPDTTTEILKDLKT